MLRRAKHLIGFTIQTADSENAGKVDDFYFDDQTWTIRYMVVDTGPWLFGRKVLLSPQALDSPVWPTDMALEKVPVNLTKEQIENSPPVDLAKPVSRQQELALHDYYHWPYYWAAVPGAVGHRMTGAVVPAPRSDELEARQQQRSTLDAKEVGDPHLRSVEEVTGYHIQAIDAEIGHVEDFFVDTEDWQIRFMLVDTRNWLPSKQVFVSPNWIERVSWHKSKVHVVVTRDQVKNGPEYDPETPVSREHEAALHSHYSDHSFHQ